MLHGELLPAPDPSQRIERPNAYIGDEHLPVPDNQFLRSEELRHAFAEAHPGRATTYDKALRKLSLVTHLIEPQESEKDDYPIPTYVMPELIEGKSALLLQGGEDEEWDDRIEDAYINPWQTDLVASIRELTGAQYVRDDEAAGSKQGLKISRASFMGHPFYLEEQFDRTLQDRGVAPDILVFMTEEAGNEKLNKLTYADMAVLGEELGKAPHDAVDMVKTRGITRQNFPENLARVRNERELGQQVDQIFAEREAEVGRLVDEAVQDPRAPHRASRAARYLGNLVKRVFGESDDV